jgi:hypothetical protein
LPRGFGSSRAAGSVGLFCIWTVGGQSKKQRGGRGEDFQQTFKSAVGHEDVKDAPKSFVLFWGIRAGLASLSFLWRFRFGRRENDLFI